MSPQSPIVPAQKAAEKKRPPSLEIAKATLQQLANSDKILPNLRYARESSRNTRRERRQALSNVLGILLQHTDLATRTFSTLGASGTRIPLSIEFIAKKSDMGARRVMRALTDLYRSGYVRSKKRLKIDRDGRFTGLNAIRILSERLFLDLGVSSARLGRDIRHARSKWNPSKKKLLQPRTWFRLIGKRLPKPTTSPNQAKIHRFLQKKRQYPDLPFDLLKHKFGYLLN